jgi:hypothetical protein
MTGYDYNTTDESITTRGHTGYILGFVDECLVLSWVRHEPASRFYDLANPLDPGGEGEEVAYWVEHAGQHYYVTGEDPLCQTEAEAVEYIHRSGGHLNGQPAVKRQATETDHFL